MRTGIPLALARICLDCETIFAEPCDHCPGCGRSAWWYLSRWLGRAA